MLGIGAAELDALIAKAERERTERSERYRGTRPPLEVKAARWCWSTTGWPPGGPHRQRRSRCEGKEQHAS
jgi:hypothetical protein